MVRTDSLHRRAGVRVQLHESPVCEYVSHLLHSASHPSPNCKPKQQTETSPHKDRHGGHSDCAIAWKRLMCARGPYWAKAVEVPPELIIVPRGLLTGTSTSRGRLGDSVYTCSLWRRCFILGCVPRPGVMTRPRAPPSPHQFAADYVAICPVAEL
jgi:hypothetical protein